MSEQFRVFPVATVDALRDQLVANPGAQLKLFYVGHTPFLQVLPAGGTAASPVTAAPATDATFAPLNDSFVCPGSPGCPS